MSRKTTILIILVVALFVIVASVIDFVFSKKPANQPVNNKTQVTQKELPLNGCLKENEVVDIKIERLGKAPTGVTYDPKYNEGIAHVSVEEKPAGKENFKFDIKNVDVGHYYLYEIHKCALYIVKEFNFDYQREKALPGYKREIWQYQYDGNGKKLVENDDFRISPPEQYISLIKGYGGSTDYSLIIKDLKTLKDAFALPIVDIVKQNPDVVGDLSFENGGWSLDGKYFWFSLNQGADIAGFVRVNTKDWSYKIFPAPQRTMGGDAFNINTGMITYGEDVAPWSGVVEIDEQLQKEALQNGKISSFYIYNLFTKKKHLIATTTDPTYYFRPQWLSDTELQYEVPSGEKKVYKIKE